MTFSTDAFVDPNDLEYVLLGQALTLLNRADHFRAISVAQAVSPTRRR
ncbi:hypothetical protein OK016_05355 [Vibrio chagasii]|nr:hypothetical protein [Vibrio chagasii]